MRKFNNPRVFDEFLMGTTTYYTSSEFNVSVRRTASPGLTRAGVAAVSCACRG
jgi:hypothetical protein